MKTTLNLFFLLFIAINLKAQTCPEGCNPNTGSAHISYIPQCYGESYEFILDGICDGVGYSFNGGPFVATEFHLQNGNSYTLTAAPGDYYIFEFMSICYNGFPGWNYTCQTTDPYIRYVNFSIPEEPLCALTANITGIDPGDYNCTDGSVNITFSTNACSGAYIFDQQSSTSYSPTGNSQTIEGLASGFHSFTIYSIPAGCQTDVSINLSNPPCHVEGTIGVLQQITDYGCNNAIIEVNGSTSSCVGLIFQLLKDNSIIYNSFVSPENNTFNVDGLSAGTYVGVFTTSDGECSDITDTIIILEPACTIGADITAIDANGYGSGCGNLGNINLIAHTGECNLLYAEIYNSEGNFTASILGPGSQYWLAEGNAASIISGGLIAGDYSVSIISMDGGCTESYPIHIGPDCSLTGTILSAMNGEISVSANTNDCLGYIAYLTDASTGDTITQGSELSENSVSFTGLSGGDYIVIFTSGSYNYSNPCSTSLPVHLSGTNTFTVKVFIQGYYTGSGMMDNYGSGACLFTNGISSLITDADSVSISLTEPTYPYNEIERQMGILQSDGMVIIELGSAIVPGNSYYIRINHRNSLETWSMDPVIIENNITYDFTDSQNKAYGNNLVQLQDGYFAMWSGDVNQDGIIESSDFSEVENAAQEFLFGYLAGDLTGDVLVESADYSLIENNSQLFLSVARP